VLAWLLMLPPQHDARFADAGESTIGSRRVDVVQVKSGADFEARLSFDSETHRLLMVTSEERPGSEPAAGEVPAPDARTAGKEAPFITALYGVERLPLTVRVELMAHRADDGIVFPHRMRIHLSPALARSPLVEEWEISRFKVNPPLRAGQFERK
jgi:hypothetical protein